MVEGFQGAGAGASGRELATLAAWGSDGKGGYVQGKLKVAPDKLPTVKAGFAQARDKFIEMQRTARDLTTIGYPANDEVSVQAVDRLRHAAGEDAGCLGKTLLD